MLLPRAFIGDIPSEVQETIKRRLDEIERDHHVRVLLAVESGSRAWGFASIDSDFDVRFLYVRRIEDYVSLFAKRDVIEQPIDTALDVSGWDLRKALSLGLKWNPALIEWLTSPITYREAGWEAEALRKLFARPMGPDALIRHYYGLAVKQFGRHVEARETVNLKKYFYVIRPAVALMWLQQRRDAMPPMSLPALLEGVTLPSAVADAIVELRARKAEQSEFGTGVRIPELDDFCIAWITWGAEHLPEQTTQRDPIAVREAERIFHASVFGRPAEGDVTAL
jgi:predicted nucleotidyltransferase